ncbi:MAG TPA: methyltransferase domain-containing protein [Acidimicrobiales bacterium]
MSEYSKDYYDYIDAGSLRSAREVVPLVLELLAPRTVVDVGCGLGAWLSVFTEHGVEDICGIDGGWVDREALRFPEERFLAADLTKRLDIQREFDLVVSLEVAEHLPTDAAADFVSSLTSLGPVILFSAAVPLQGGDGHLNEQWPEYWAAHFAKHRYVPVDCLRRRIWDNDDVDWWYVQNTLFFVKSDAMGEYPKLEKERLAETSLPLPVIHPRCYVASVQHGVELQQRVEELSRWAEDLKDLTPGSGISLKKVLVSLPRFTMHSIRARLRSWRRRRCASADSATSDPGWS